MTQTDGHQTRVETESDDRGWIDVPVVVVKGIRWVDGSGRLIIRWRLTDVAGQENARVTEPDATGTDARILETFDLHQSTFPDAVQSFDDLFNSDVERQVGIGRVGRLGQVALAVDFLIVAINRIRCLARFNHAREHHLRSVLALIQRPLFQRTSSFHHSSGVDAPSAADDSVRRALRRNRRRPEKK